MKLKKEEGRIFERQKSKKGEEEEIEYGEIEEKDRGSMKRNEELGEYKRIKV